MTELAGDLITFIRDAGALGIAIYVAAYVGATVLFIPGSILTIGAGFAYGLGGVALVLPSAVIGSLLAFWLGRSVARGWVERRVASRARFAAVDDAVAENGFEVVLLLRLSPVFPFSVLNYALGLSRVTTRDYILASTFGMIPGTFLYVYIGSLITNVTQLAAGDIPSTGIWGQVAFWGGLVATAVATIAIARLARRKLDEVIDKPPPLSTVSPRE